MPSLRALLLLTLCCCLPLGARVANPPVRVGLDTQALEYIVGLEGGGEVQSLDGRGLLRLKDGEKLRVWWDSKGEADPTDE